MPTIDSFHSFIAVWCILIAGGFIALTRKKSFSMPQFYDETIKHKDTGLEKLPALKKQIFLFLIVVFFTLSGGVIRVFQSMSMTFALCGPLQLDSHRYVHSKLRSKVFSLYKPLLWIFGYTRSNLKS